MPAQVKPSSPTPAQATAKPVSIHELVVWKDNPRKSRTQAQKARLRASIRAVGVVQNLVARPLGKAGPWEVIAGNGRLVEARAIAQEDGLADFLLPVTIREITDEEAVLIALAENGDRDGLEPMDEARAYGRLADAGLSTAEIAARAGKPEALVRSRLRLLALPAYAQRAIEEHRLPLGAAALVVALEQDVERIEVLTSVGIVDDGVEADVEVSASEPVSIPEVRRAIEQNRRQLSRAPFPILDQELVPTAGPCSSCPKHTGAQGFLFGAGVDTVDHCLDAVCWSGKVKAHQTHTLADLTSRYPTLESLGAGAAPAEWATWRNKGGRLPTTYDSEWAGVDEPFGSMKSLAELAAAAERTGSLEEAIVVAVDPEGFPCRLVPRAVATEIECAAEEADTDDDADPTVAAAAEVKRKAQQKEDEKRRKAAEKARAALARRRKELTTRFISALEDAQADPATATALRLLAALWFEPLSEDDAKEGLSMFRADDDKVAAELIDQAMGWASDLETHNKQLARIAVEAGLIDESDCPELAPPPEPAPKKKGRKRAASAASHRAEQEGGAA